MLRAARVVGKAPHEGRLTAGALTFRCALGRAGLKRDKREGDGATPLGRMRLLYAFIRPGRFSNANLRFSTRRLHQNDLWCDDAGSRQYNRFFRSLSAQSKERLWREDRLYDFIGVLDYNLKPTVLGRGSAIFFHIATPNYAPTEGCIAVSAVDLRKLAARFGRQLIIRVN